MTYKRRIGAFGIAALTLILLVSLMMPLVSVEAAPPGVAEPDEEVVEAVEDIWIYDEDGKPLKISIADVGQNCEEICICVACAFRATQVAISELWDLEEEYPRQGDFEITSAHPSSGHECAFEYITGVVSGETYVVEMPEGTSAINLTLENYAYTFTRMDTEDSFDVQVKEGVFPDGFFELRAQVKSGAATQDEIDLFASQWEEVRDKFLTLPPWELFEDIEEPGEEPCPVWPTVFALGLTVLVLGVVVFQAVGVRRRRR